MARALTSAFVVASLLSGCGGSGTTPSAAELDPLDARLFAHVPTNALVIGRLDGIALRRSSAWEAASASTSTEARQLFGSVDRVLVAIGPMLPGRGLLDPRPQAPETEAGAGAGAGAEAGAGAGAEEGVEEGEDFVPLELDPESATGLASERDIASYREWFGDRVPAFAILTTSSDRGPVSACTSMRAQLRAPSRRVADADVYEERGIATFFSRDGTCGIVSSSWLDAVLAPHAGFAAPIVRLMRGAHEHDLGVFGYATSTPGVLRELVANTSETLGATERRFVDWFGKVLEILDRGVRGSSAILWLDEGRIAIESRTEYADRDRAAAHAVLADMTRELVQVTSEALASQFEGLFPIDFAQNLRIERDGAYVLTHWDVSERSLTDAMRSAMNPAATAEDSPWLAGMQDGFAFAQVAAIPGPAEERIASLEPQRADLESTYDTANCERLVALGEAYVVRGRWEDARALFESFAARAERAGDPEGVAEARYRLALVDERVGDLSAASAHLSELLDGDAEIAGLPLDGIRVHTARLLREAGRPDRATQVLDVAERLVTFSDRALALGVERERLRDPRDPERTRTQIHMLRGVVERLGGDEAIDVAYAVEAEVELTFVPRVRTSADQLEELRDSVRRRIALAYDDPIEGAARASLLGCRLARLDPQPGSAEQDCTAATLDAVSAHGEHHPAVAEAFLARAELALVRGDRAAADDALTAAERALEGLPAHPLRAAIAALRARRPAPRR